MAGTESRGDQREHLAKQWKGTKCPPRVQRPVRQDAVILLFMRSWSALAASLITLSLAGCHSAYIEAVVSNHTGQPLSVVEVDYPSASFGADTIAPGQDFKYRFKIQGSGNLKVLWTDAAQHDHSVNGPELHEGAEGALHIVIGPDGKVDWQEKLKTR